ncbi:PoNe immunity protein domain-containing protein [Luteimonas sp. SMYT11W]|uniref:PoNe immunity protein domain-containing protein n=1 Tax=Luteimonas flava TaxID=3115822 RepID=A0ABU7WEL8_9GAMM
MTAQPRLRIDAGNWYWDKWSRSLDDAIAKSLRMAGDRLENPVYEPQFAFNAATRCLDAMLFLYAKGDSIAKVARYFPTLLDMWERSNRLADAICAQERLTSCRDWAFDLKSLSHYDWCFRLVGLALALDVPDAQWTRLLSLVGGEGEDELLDRVISAKHSDRMIGQGVLHPRPYARLLRAIEAPEPDRPALLREFVEHWYQELRQNNDEHLWWYHFGDVQIYPLEKFLYVGRWCVEAVAAVKAFGIDDASCLDHPHYPGDLVEDGRAPRFPLGVSPQGIGNLKFGTSPKKTRVSDWVIRVLTGKSPLQS